ncbi:SDR family oxidoreductase [Paraburkholderia sp. Tr-20389]|uniref:SDR family oxidoreductase n=1 Tax=Paraburkholderia sp. Tr-20389 TaxID=2703903 RepID=UPI0019803559|nr:SDR family oxidoreductase [Paraburkholderia sp. Tr-20389]MBN3752568.1 SDR family oxidoreductase [Paraburkholderia sp. Tr-20389]
MNATTSVRAIVTGHTRGLGAALVERLLAQGIAVLGISRSRNEALSSQANFDQVEVDLSDAERLTQFVARDTLRNFLEGAQTALLFNNAGTVQPIGPVEAQDVAAIAQAVTLNVSAPLMLASAFATASPGASDRRIVHISSGAARHPYAGWSIYCATKAALDHHARSVALDQNRALRICSVAPGVVDTNMQAEIRGTELERFPMREKFEELKRDGKLSTPEESAGKLVDYVLSETFGAVATADVRELPQS